VPGGLKSDASENGGVSVREQVVRHVVEGMRGELVRVLMEEVVGV
jgi:hypothetical protein